MEGLLKLITGVGNWILKGLAPGTAFQSAMLRTLQRGGLGKAIAGSRHISLYNKLVQRAAKRGLLLSAQRPILTTKGILTMYAPHLVGAGTLGAGAYLGYKMLKSSELNKKAFFEYIPLILGLGLGARTLLKFWRGHAGWAKAFKKAIGKVTSEAAETIGRGAEALKAQKAAKKLLKARKPTEIPKELPSFLKPFEEAAKAAPEKFQQSLARAYERVIKETNKAIRQAKAQVPIKYRPNIYQRLGGLKGLGLAALPTGAGIAIYGLMKKKEPQYVSTPYYGIIPYYG